MVNAPRQRLSRSLLFRTSVLFATFLLTTPGPARPASQMASPEAISRVLETSEVSQVLHGVLSALLGEVEVQSSHVPSRYLTRLRTLAPAHFSEPRLRETVLERMRADSDEETVSELLGWLEADSTEEFRRIVREHETSESLADYAKRIERQRPGNQRLTLTTRHARAQGAGRFYVTMRQVTQRAAHDVLVAAGVELESDPDARDREIESQREDYLNLAILSFLQRYEPVSDEQLLEITERWESPSGQWYVDAYTAAVSAAIRRAGEGLAQQLRDGSADANRGPGERRSEDTDEDDDV